jgi:hypothetical protein
MLARQVLYLSHNSSPTTFLIEFVAVSVLLTVAREQMVKDRVAENR